MLWAVNNQSPEQDAKQNCQQALVHAVLSRKAARLHGTGGCKKNHCCSPWWTTVGPEKKIFSPPPPQKKKTSPIPPSRAFGPIPLPKTPPLLGFSIKTDPPPPPRSAPGAPDSPVPLPEQKKKKYPKRPPSHLNVMDTSNWLQDTHPTINQPLIKIKL